MMNQPFRIVSVNTIVVGGGQAGLAVGYHLARRNISFLVLDANQRIGDAWRNRWDSLRLFTPARYVGLDGLPFPGRGDAFPTKDELADYLERYAQHFRLPVQNGVRVDSLRKQDNGFLLTAGRLHYQADNVVVAMANYQRPKTPAYAEDLSPEIVQIHSHDYRNPTQLQAGGVLIVGVGNSGADIGIEVSRAHRTWISGTESGHIPWPIESAFGRHFLIRVVRFVGHHLLTTDTPIGRKARPNLLKKASPLVRVKPDDLIQAGIERVPRVIGVRDGKPLLEDKRTLDVRNVIWCTGYDPGFNWIELPIFTGEKGTPRHERGVVAEVPGLYFVGLHFQYAMTSATLAGVSRDAEYVVNALQSRQPIVLRAAA